MRARPNISEFEDLRDIVEHRSTPAMCSAAGRQALAITTTKYEGGLLLSWNDGNTFRRFQQFLGNALVGRSHDLVEDLSSSLNAPCVSGAIRRRSGQDKTRPAIETINKFLCMIFLF